MAPLQEERQLQALTQLSLKYGNDDRHASIVQEAALKIFDSLNGSFDLFNEDRLLLSHASLLHDIGSFISNKKHNRHSKYIIDNDSILQDYPEEQKKLLSLIVFNHRKKIHKDTNLLSKRERETVLKLSAILRVADSLDFCRESIKIKKSSLLDSELKIFIEGVLPERIEGRLRQKKRLFQELFKLDVTLDS